MAKLTRAQKKAIKDFEGHWIFDFMFKEDIRDGTMTFDDAWQRNIDWLDDHLTDTRFFYSKYKDPARQDEEL